MKLYVARDMNGYLYLYIGRPNKIDDCWICSSSEDMMEIDKALFPEIKWENTEPTEVELVIKKYDRKRTKTTSC